MFYGEVIKKSKMLKSDTSKHIQFLKNLIRKWYDWATIVESLRQAYIVENIGELLVQPVGQTSN